MESDRNGGPFQVQDLGNRWSKLCLPNKERLSYGLLALLYVLILSLFITMFTRSSTFPNHQLISKTEIEDFKNKVSELSSEMDRLESTFKRKTCKNSWIQFENSCYYISKTRLNWAEARSMCQEKESDLIVINNEREQVFIVRKTTPDFFKKYWIGLHYASEEGLWKWVDGTNYETSYKTWTKKFQRKEEEDCTSIWSDENWNPVMCDYIMYVICERPIQAFV